MDESRDRSLPLPPPVPICLFHPNACCCLRGALACCLQGQFADDDADDEEENTERQHTGAEPLLSQNSS